MGSVNYYRNIWARLLHKLAPITKITPSKVKFKWTKIEQDTFEEMKRIVPCNVLIAYQDFNE